MTVESHRFHDQLVSPGMLAVQMYRLARLSPVRGHHYGKVNAWQRGQLFQFPLVRAHDTGLGQHQDTQEAPPFFRHQGGLMIPAMPDRVKPPRNISRRILPWSTAKPCSVRAEGQHGRVRQIRRLAAPALRGIILSPSLLMADSEGSQND